MKRSGRATPRLRPSELEDLRIRLVCDRAALRKRCRILEDEAWRKGPGAGELSATPNHQADLGTDTCEQEVSVALMESEMDRIREIDAALERMDLGSYGICEECGRPISRDRLRAIPHARMCLPCKREEESWN